MNYIDQKYIQLVSSHLKGFKKVGNNYNFRCPLCGDSAKSKSKKRGWILTGKASPLFYCHNCGASHNFSNFLKDIDYVLYKQYVYELMNEKYGKSFDVEKNPEMTTPLDSVKKIIWKESFLSVCTSVNDLPSHHAVNLYLDNRLIPSNKRKNLYYIDDMQKIHELDKDDKYKDRIAEKDSRLVMPVWSKKGLIGISCRSLESDAKKRYVIYKFDEKKPMIFNLYDINGNLMIDPNKPVFVTEGALDSLFLDNAIAVNGADLMRVMKMLKDLDLIFIPDNEPRNKDIVRVFKKVINSNNQVVIFPDRIDEKDINNMVLKFGYEDIIDVINNNVFRGAVAQLHLNLWKRI